MILCEMDKNVIMSEPMKKCTAGEIVRAYQALMKRLKAAGINPKKHILDNKASAEYKEAIKAEGLEYELVPKGQHRRNIAERAIQTWKSHTIGILSGVPSNFPLSMWDELLTQIDMQVNLLRFSNIAPKVCAWTVLGGQHNSNRHPLAPLGIEMHMLEQPDKQRSWGVKSKRAFYVGTSLEHYRYHWGYCTNTKKIRGSETVKFKHKYLTAPTISPADAIVQASNQLADTLRGNIPSPLLKSGIDHIRALTSIFDETGARAEAKAKEEEEQAAPPRVKERAAAPRVKARAANSRQSLRGCRKGSSPQHAFCRAMA